MLYCGVVYDELFLFVQLEVALEEANQRLKDHLASSARKTKELEEKLLAAENLCSKVRTKQLLTGGRE